MTRRPKNPPLNTTANVRVVPCCGSCLYFTQDETCVSSCGKNVQWAEVGMLCDLYEADQTLIAQAAGPFAPDVQAAELAAARAEIALLRQPPAYDAVWSSIAALVEQGHPELVRAMAQTEKLLVDAHAEVKQAKALVTAMLDYRQRVGALGFQLEKADDHFRALAAWLEAANAPRDQREFKIVRQLAEAQAALSQVEWSALDGDNGLACCPVCRGYKSGQKHPLGVEVRSGHAPGCSLSAAMPAGQAD